MNSKSIANGIVRAVAIIVGVVLLAYFIYRVRSVIAYLVIAAVVALIGRPVVLFLRQKFKFPNTMAVIVTIMGMLAIFIGLFALFVPLVTEQGKNLKLLNIDDLQKSLNALYWEVSKYFGAPPAAVNDLIKETDIEKNMLKGMDFGFIPNFLNSFVQTLSDVSIGLFSVLFISFFFLKDSKLLQKSLLMLVPKHHESNLITSINKINNLLSRYFMGLLLQLLILFAIYSLVLFIVGIENAVVIAFLCALFNVIPYIGPIIGGAIMLVLTMTSNLGSDFSSVILPKAGYVLIGIIIGQLVDNFFSQPFIFSNSVKSHPLEIFLVIIIAGLLFGVVGMIVAVPGYTALKVVLKEFTDDNRLVNSLTKDL